jgi:hypothetical protein
MNAEETVIALRTLGAAYGHVQPSPDTIELWANVFHSDDATLVLTGIREWVLTESRFPTPADLRRYMRQARMEGQAALPPTRTCDGTGWREIEEGLMPCSVCNTALHAVYSDHVKLRRFRDGEPVSRLVNPDQLLVQVAYCQPWRGDDPTDPVVPPRIGRRIAYNAHVEDAAARGIAPMDERPFMAMLGVSAMSDRGL